MEGNIGYSLFLGVAFVAAWGAFWLLPKSKEQLQGSIWLVLSFLMTLFAEGVIAGILGLLSIRINILTMGIIYLMLCILIIITMIIQKRGCQKYLWNKFDIIAMGLLAIVVAGIYLHVYGTHMAFVFKNSDGAVHFGNAMCLVRNQSLLGMYFSSLYAAGWIEFLMPWLKAVELWRGFVIADSLMLLLEGWVFFILIRSLLKGKCGNHSGNPGRFVDYGP